MGAWGPKLFQDDIAEDVKDTYIDLLKQGEDNEEITKKLIEEYEEYDHVEDLIRKLCEGKQLLFE